MLNECAGLLLGIPYEFQDTLYKLIMWLNVDFISEIPTQTTQVPGPETSPQGNQTSESKTPRQGSQASESKTPSQGSQASESKTPSQESQALESKTPTQGSQTSESKTPSQGNEASESKTPSQVSHASEIKLPTQGSQASESKTPSQGSQASESKTPSQESQALESKTPTQGSQTSESITPSQRCNTPSRTQTTKLMKAECLGMTNQHQEAQDIEISRLDRSEADALYVRGLCALYQDQISSGEKLIDHAIGCFQKLSHHAPDHDEALKKYKETKNTEKYKLLKLKTEQGNEAFHKGDWQKALDLYNEALNIDENNKEENAKLHYNKAEVYAKQKELMKSALACTEALELEENYVKALLRRAQCYTELEDHEDAVEDYEKLYQINPSQENKQLLDEANKKLKEYKKTYFYYKILGIETTASADDITKAYRKCALLYHPDRHRDSGNAVIHVMERKFKQVGEAHAVLSDPLKRAQYDRSQCDDYD